MLVFLAGCSTVQIGHLFFGLTPNDVKTSEQKYEESFNKSASYCYEKSIEALNAMPANILHRDANQHFIVANKFEMAFPLCIDTTELGILVTESGENKATVEIASGNYSLAEFVSKELFKKLKNTK